MSYHYYSSPMDVGGITGGVAMDTCNLGESISQMLFMIISTRKGEMPGDPHFGCDIWELQFERIVDQRRWEDAISVSLLAGIQRYEKRLENTSITVVLQEVEVAYPFRQFPEIKKQATIHVMARLTHSQENFRFSTNVYVSPLSS